jgi:hypothetical protein
LVEHLKDGGTLAARHAAFNEIPVLMKNGERADFVVKHFTSKQLTRPAKRKTLESQIQVLFGKALSPEELEETISALVARKAVEFTAKDEVIYRL